VYEKVGDLSKPFKEREIKMKCYVHPERDAICTCVGCGNFICEGCARLVEKCTASPVFV
jgi:hypothetical protein